MAVDRRAYDDIVNFFARGSTATDVLSYRPSPEAQERVQYLLAKNKSAELTPDEAAELERFGEIEHFMQLVKARAHQYVESES